MGCFVLLSEPQLNQGEKSFSNGILYCGITLGVFILYPSVTESEYS